MSLMKKILSLTLVLLMGITAANAAERVNHGKFKAGIYNDSYVMFAKGNMGYNGTTHAFDIYSSTYESHGGNSQYIASDWYGTWDLFGWGTSNKTVGSYSYAPWMTSEDKADYAKNMIAYTNVNAGATYRNYDWATAQSVNAEPAGTYQTPNQDQWDYILNKRDNAAKLQGAAKVSMWAGYVILPDNWSTPLDLKFVPGATDPTTNTYTLQQWSIMEEAGAVFLPMFGYRLGTTWTNDGLGHYWASSTPKWEGEDQQKTAVQIVLGGETPQVTRAPFSQGNAVRLIENKKHTLTTVTEEITETITDPLITEFAWHGYVLTKSGDYTFTTLEVEEDKDKIETLHLVMAYDAAIDNVSSQAVKAQKVIRDGQLFIIRGEKTFNAAGQQVK